MLGNKEKTVAAEMKSKIEIIFTYRICSRSFRGGC